MSNPTPVFLTWSGFTVIGDAASIAEVRKLVFAPELSPNLEDAEDAARLRFLCFEHKQLETRSRVASILDRVTTMSLSAVRMAVDGLMQEETKRKKDAVEESLRYMRRALEEYLCCDSDLQEMPGVASAIQGLEEQIAEAEKCLSPK